MPEKNLQDTEKVGIERRLIKHSLSQPIARGNPLCPFVVGPAVARKMIKERNGLDLDEVEKAQDERDYQYCGDPKQIGLTGRVVLRCNRRARLFSSRRPFFEPSRTFFHSRRSLPAQFSAALRLSIFGLRVSTLFDNMR